MSIPGPAGAIELIVEEPLQAPRGIALVCHPHPLFGGTAENKVVQTLANFRGVGASAGSHDEGDGETEDMLAVLEWAHGRYGDLPVVLAGFSFGAYVQTRVARRLAQAGRKAERLVLVAVAAGTVGGARHYELESVPIDTVVIHGDLDETVPLANVLAWARPLELHVVVVPGADHFFHHKLNNIRDIVTSAWKP
jgi:alpha/beta superfamily hydrolase